MGSYEIDVKGSAQRDLYKLDRPIIPRVTRAIEALSVNPFPPNIVKLRDTENMYRLRVGDYRVVYEVNTNTQSKTVIIHYIRHRKDVYRRL